jgi:hypothetical protein
VQWLTDPAVVAPTFRRRQQKLVQSSRWSANATLTTGRVFLTDGYRDVPPPSNPRAVLAHELRRLTEHDSLSREAVRRRLAENDLKPWRKDMWCIPQVDGKYVACMEVCSTSDPRPPIPSIRSLFFEASPPQKIGAGREPIRTHSGQIERYDCEYKRNGTANLFVFLDVHRPWRKVKVTNMLTCLVVDSNRDELADQL